MVLREGLSTSGGVKGADLLHRERYNKSEPFQSGVALGERL
jgi:hypothetical protein